MLHCIYIICINDELTVVTVLFIDVNKLIIVMSSLLHPHRGVSSDTETANIKYYLDISNL